RGHPAHSANAQVLLCDRRGRVRDAAPGFTVPWPTARSGLARSAHARATGRRRGRGVRAHQPRVERLRTVTARTRRTALSHLWNFQNRSNSARDLGAGATAAAPYGTSTTFTSHT